MRRGLSTLALLVVLAVVGGYAYFVASKADDSTGVKRDRLFPGLSSDAIEELTEPRLTTVRYPLHEMSTRAVRRLVEAAEHDKPPAGGNEIISTHLVMRDSSDPSQTGDKKAERRK